jgi:hypothetical protein
MAINKKQKSHKSHKSRKSSKSQRGGFTKPVMNQKGGSPASTLVMQDTTLSPIMNDYVVSDRIRQAGYDNSLASLEPRCGQKGGSPASDLVMEQLSGVPETKAYPEGWKVKGDMNSLNLYQTTGGSRRRNNRNRNNHSKKNNKNNRRNSRKNNNNNSRKHKRNNNNSRHNNKNRTQRGGGSDWIMSQYSLGNINANAMSAPVSQFSQSEGVPRDVLMNPPNMGLAGSGYPMGSLEGANVRQVGAPLA